MHVRWVPQLFARIHLVHTPIVSMCTMCVQISFSGITCMGRTLMLVCVQCVHTIYVQISLLSCGPSGKIVRI